METESTQLFWKEYLYEIQKEAPKPLAILCQTELIGSPSQYGVLYHGCISKRDCNKLLKTDGSYLVRKSDSAPNNFILSLRSCAGIKHYKLYYEINEHFVGRKRFRHLHDLIADGLVVHYLESCARDLQDSSTTKYEKSPCNSIHTSKEKAFQQLHILNDFEQSMEDQCSKESDLNDYGTILCDKYPSPDTVQKGNTLNKIYGSRGEINASNESLCIRSHRFKAQSFKGLNWCGYCGNFLWGLMLQGVKCQDCGVQSHRHCSLKLPNDCCTNTSDFQCIFGMDLDTSLQWMKSGEEFVPQIVIDCIDEVDIRGLLIEGIYRVSGSQDQIEFLKLSFERDGHNNFCSEKSLADINAVAGLLKLYLRLLPNRLITQECFQKLIEASQINVHDSKICKVKEAIQSLSYPHYSTLRIVIQHLSRVCEHCAVNKMTATSIGTIFGPTIVEFQENDLLQPSDLLVLKISAQEPRVVEMLVLLSADIFT